MDQVWQHIQKMTESNNRQVNQFQRDDALALSQMEIRLTALEGLLGGYELRLQTLSDENKRLTEQLGQVAAVVVSTAQLSNYAERRSLAPFIELPMPKFSQGLPSNSSSHFSPTVNSNSVPEIKTGTTISSSVRPSLKSGDKPRFVFHSDVAVRTQLESWCTSSTPLMKLVFHTTSAGQSPYQTFTSHVNVIDAQSTENLYQGVGSSRSKRDAEAAACKNLILSNFIVTHMPPEKVN